MGAELRKVAQGLVAPGKGILAADESGGTIEKRFASIGVASTEENRRSYRELLFTTPRMENSISGVILFDETTKQESADGIRFVELLAQKGVRPGIKTDKGLETFGKYEEQTTKGLEGLVERSKDYKDFGLVFAKARSVFKIAADTPTEELIIRNAEFQTKYAQISQAAGLMPIVEPEVLIDGDHSIEKCKKVSFIVLGEVFAQLKKGGIDFRGMLLKPSMITPGKSSQEKVTDEEIARETIDVLLQTVPSEVPGIVFLSGGQTPDEATRRLRLMNKLYKNSVPWQLSFSFGRALQDAPLKAWVGKPENTKDAQEAFLYWANLNSLARSGR
ncbi:MAG: class I fructose-bisphosphate aldolase [Patescibacteria group bacterium]